MLAKIIQGEVLYPPVSGLFDGVFCDPPYALTANKKGGRGEASLNEKSPAGRSRITTGGGFMGKKWDSKIPGPEYWKAILDVCKPGAMLLAFGGTRTYHRLTCAIEDAGWEIRDCLMWIYSQGFPKSHDISKAIDKSLGAKRRAIKQKKSDLLGEREEIVRSTDGCGNTEASIHKQEGFAASRESTYDVTAPATDEAERWVGYGTALKPSWEPIILAMKPLDGTFANNALKHGIAGLNIDGGRIPTDDKLGGGMVSKGRPNVSEGWDRPWMHDKKITEKKKIESASKVIEAESKGRWPANLIRDESEEVIGLFPITTSGRRSAGVREGMGYHGADGDGGPAIEGDTGSAARFFYCAKASRRERNAGLEGMEKRCGGGMQGTNDQSLLTGSGNQRNPWMQNHHPTVKPLALCEYLARLILPPERETPRRLLVPFAGVMSEAIGGILAGWDVIIGIEGVGEYCQIARRRLDYWAKEIEKQGTLNLEA